ncbi:MAG: hypothetical protein KAW12_08255 [Candidatus Aminicenantes bacterium]|nr:hypothetical protein [Candidatus Aminicenantes bacterium]
MFLILFLSIIIFLSYLVVERIILDRRLESIPVRICVTGTRGKSSVVRMLTTILRAEGKKTLGKITGSRAAYILPDGEETAVRRRGVVSIIEQKNLVRKAANLKVDYLITEIMSIHPENHFIESQRLLKPHILVITNVRRDHTDAMGSTIDEIAAVLSSCITAKSTVFILEKENRPVFSTAAEKAGAELIRVKEESPENIIPQIKKSFFPGNISLVATLFVHLKRFPTAAGIASGGQLFEKSWTKTSIKPLRGSSLELEQLINGLKKVKHDTSEFNIRRYSPEQTQKTFFLTNAFAANDPRSTFEIITKINKIFPFSTGKLVGLLNLRADRGDRTVQWIEALKNGSGDFFKCIYVTGAHTKIVKKKLKNIVILKHKQPEKMMAKIIQNSMPEASAAETTSSHPQTGTGQAAPAAKTTDHKVVILGFGNIKGAGNLLINYWNKIGEEYGL